MDVRIIYVDEGSNTGHFEWRPLWIFPQTSHPISNGQLIQVWEKYDNYVPSTSSFPDFWQNCLVVVPSGNNHPLLVWGNYPFDKDIPEIFHYSIDRKNGSLDWECDIDQTASTVCFYEDEDFTMPVFSSHNVYYRVRAVKSESPTVLYTGYTNTASISVSGYDPGKKNIYYAPVFIFELDQNYPNPFNPSTKINYSIRKAGNIKLEVFDIYGSRVAVIVDGLKQEGDYSVDFDGSRLASGIYVYRFQAGDFISTRKMTLLK